MTTPPPGLPHQSPCGYEPVSHTADLGMRVWADSPESLYATAAVGMFRLMGDPPPLDPVHPFIVVSRGVDREDLLVRMLSDLLVRFDTDDVYVTAAACPGMTVPAGDGDFEVHLRCEGGTLDRNSDAGRGLGEIKAVTYHGLSVIAEGGRHEATVIFDL